MNINLIHGMREKSLICFTIVMLILFFTGQLCIAEDSRKGEIDIQGFRAAHFGMTEDEVMKAIINDFNARKNQVVKGLNPLEKTVTLSVLVNNLLPESGKSLIVYIFGYTSKKLIQINIVWGVPVEKKPDISALVSTANVLNKYFSALRFNPEKTVINRPLKDGSIIVFQSADEKDRMVRLELKKSKTKDSGAMSLQLSYVKDPRSPDIFIIKKGLF
ncbi:MAG: hypothetical protein HQK84_01165 [Nitrospinae bacterium]|nr:hypothetical protein [Nitrospinota bacterium]